VAEDKLTKDDLVLLMESYRNMINMHQAVLNQTAKTLEKLNAIDSKQDSLRDKNSSLCNYLTKILDTLDNQDKMGHDISFKVSQHEKKSIEDHNKLANKIHLGWVGMGSIILGLIALVITIINYLHGNPIPPVH
jgi:hypothetical protein